MRFNTIEEQIKKDIDDELPLADAGSNNDRWLYSIAKSLIIIRNELKFIRNKM